MSHLPDFRVHVKGFVQASTVVVLCMKFLNPKVSPCCTQIDME